jgi:hypothetical protein
MFCLATSMISLSLEMTALSPWMTTVSIHYTSMFSHRKWLLNCPSSDCRWRSVFLQNVIPHQLHMHAHAHAHAHTLWCSLRSETLLCSNQAIPFPLVELQSKWVAGVLSGWIELPSKGEMMEDVKAFYSKLEARGWPKRYTHNLSNCQVDVYEYLVKLCDMITILGYINIS